jgi:hypothetical protein
LPPATPTPPAIPTTPPQATLKSNNPTPKGVTTGPRVLLSVSITKHAAPCDGRTYALFLVESTFSDSQTETQSCVWRRYSELRQIHTQRHAIERNKITSGAGAGQKRQLRSTHSQIREESNLNRNFPAKSATSKFLCVSNVSFLQEREIALNRYLKDICTGAVMSPWLSGILCKRGGHVLQPHEEAALAASDNRGVLSKIPPKKKTDSGGSAVRGAGGSAGEGGGEDTRASPVNEWHDLGCLREREDGTLSAEVEAKQHTLYNHYTLTIHSLYTHYILTIHSLYTHYTLTIHSLYTHYTLTIHSLYTHYTLTIHPLHTHYTLTIHSLYTHYTPTIHSLYTHYTLTIHSLHTHHTLTIHSLYTHCTPTIHSLYTTHYRRRRSSIHYTLTTHSL